MRSIETIIDQLSECLAHCRQQVQFQLYYLECRSSHYQTNHHCSGHRHKYKSSEVRPAVDKIRRMSFLNDPGILYGKRSWQ
ncbi:hypothetical protein I6I97_17725 [Sphingobacterium multivorum]|nr:hypothetical protein I6I97_17725 [Sphingobacterium multivorum]HBI88830.1 hypothetical protein [Sphingobacterium sp.]HBW80008.1 hypothetical protein [Sphingobacterium sp.]